MKLAVFHNLPSGGALRALYDKIRYLEERGHSVTLYTFTSAEEDFLPLPRLTGGFFKFPMNFECLFRCRNYIRATKQAAQAINQSDAEIILVDKCRYFGSPPVLQFIKKPSIFYAHEPLGLREYEALVNEGRNIREVLMSAVTHLSFREKCRKVLTFPERNCIKSEDRRSMESAGRVLTSSYFTAGWIRRVYGIEAAVCYQGVDADFFTPDANVAKRLQLLSVGRIEKRKGHDFLICAISKIPPPQRPPLIIVCDAINEQIKRELEFDAKNLEVCLRIVYRPSQEQLREYYRSSSLVLCAGLHEPFGLVPLEAMACGTPVVAVEEGGYRETVVDGRTGYLLKRDERLWADTIFRLINSERHILSLGESGRTEVLARWTWEGFTERLLGYLVPRNLNALGAVSPN